MSSLGQMWRAFDPMVERSLSREVHGGLIAKDVLARSRDSDKGWDFASAPPPAVRPANAVA